MNIENEKENSNLLNKKREYSKKIKHQKIKVSLLNIIEFYFCDENIYNNKFIRNKIKNSKGLTLDELLTFNKIKLLLNHIESNEIKKKIIKNSISESNKLFYDSEKKMIKRKIPFVFNKNYMKEFDERTIYIENIPLSINEDIIKKIFKDFKVKFISLPKFKGSKQNKGFCFITFDTKENSLSALKLKNNTVPNELISYYNKHVTNINILTKNEWLKQKENMNNLQNNIKKLNMNYIKNYNLNFNNANDSDENININDTNNNNNNNEKIEKNSLLKIYPLNKNIELDDLYIFTSNYIKPKFIEIVNNNENLNEEKFAILRFESSIEVNNFMDLYAKSKEFLDDEDKLTIEPIIGEEENKIIVNIEQKIKEYKNKPKKVELKIKIK
jgi:RNA recognition motif-containing protein